MKIAFFGSSLVSAYWNGAATYYRGLVKYLHELGHQITFYEPDAFERQQHRDMPDPDWAKVVVYPATEDAVFEMLQKTAGDDILIKASGVGVFDDLLEKELVNHRQAQQLALFWDVDAPATLSALRQNPEHHMHRLLPQYDGVFTYGGGQPVVEQYLKMGARQCVPVYNACDPDTHHPEDEKEEFAGDLAFLGNRLPDRETRVEEFFLKAAELSPKQKFLIGGSGWDDKKMPENVQFMGHVYTKDHNAFNCSPKAVLNISRESMASNGFSPATRVFEVAGAGACLITDYWVGIDQFFEPGKEILVAKNAEEVAGILKDLTREEAAEIGKAAYQRVQQEHTYRHRAEQAQEEFKKLLDKRKAAAV